MNSFKFETIDERNNSNFKILRIQLVQIEGVAVETIEKKCLRVKDRKNKSVLLEIQRNDSFLLNNN